MTTSKLVYVAGPFTAPTQWEIERNCHRAEMVAYRLWELGYMPVTPHLLGRHFYGALDESVVMEGLLTLLGKCDAMYVLPGWENSRGTQKEIEHCARLNIPVWRCLEDLASLFEVEETIVADEGIEEIIVEDE